MTLEHFLSSTRETADTPLRAAMVSALASLGDPVSRAFAPHRVGGYPSFYRAVVREIERTTGVALTPWSGAGRGHVCHGSRLSELRSLGVRASAGEDSLQIVLLPADQESLCKEHQ